MFRLLFERSADAITLQDPLTGAFVDVNDASVRLTGATDKAALLGSNPESISPQHQPDGSLSSVKVKEVIRHAVERGSHRFEWVITRFDGTQLPVEIVLTLIRGGKKPLLLSVSRDITERRRIENELRENQQLLVSVADNISEAIYRTNPAHELIFANRAYLRISGFNSFEELRHVPREKLYANPSDRARLLHLLKTNGHFRNEEIQFIRRDGGRWWGLTNSNAVRDELTGDVLYHVGSVADITERKEAADEIQKLNASLEESQRARAEYLLRESEEKFKALFALSPLGMARVSWDGRFLQVNDSFARILGRKPDEVLTLSYWDVTPREYEERERAVLTMLQQTGRFGPYEKEYLHRDGHRVPITINGMVVKSPDGADDIWGIVEDITERKRSEATLRESEEKFRALFEASSQGVMLHDEHQYLEVNPAIVEMLGYGSANELIGLHPSKTSPPIQPSGEATDALAQKYIQECFANGSVRFDWVAQRKDGTLIPVEVILTRIQWGGRQIIQAAVNDISQRKQAEAELLKSLAREKELGQLKSNFVSMVSHEFRTPLGVIMSSAEILDTYLDQLSPEDRREQLLSINKNARRMAGLMEEVLVLGMVESGKMDFQPAQLNFAALCQRLVDELQSATVGKCPIRISMSDDAADIFADERLLQHIFINLLSNAVKYSPAGSPVALEIERAGVNAICRIRDRGMGIPEADIERLFSAFYRGSNASLVPGTGLGLTIVKRCVELHRGEIKVESIVGCGTTVTVRLPLFPSDQQI